MKRYWLFGGHCFYPDGGMDDFHASYDELADACDEARRRRRRGEYQSATGWGWAGVFDSKKLLWARVKYNGTVDEWRGIRGT